MAAGAARSPAWGLTIGGRVDIVTAALGRQVALPARWKDDNVAFLSGRRGDHSRLLWKRREKVTRAGPFGDWVSTSSGPGSQRHRSHSGRAMLVGGMGGGPLASLGGGGHRPHTCDWGLARA